jgi:hypothetical protein
MVCVPASIRAGSVLDIGGSEMAFPCCEGEMKEVIALFGLFSTKTGELVDPIPFLKAHFEGANYCPHCRTALKCPHCGRFI